MGTGSKVAKENPTPFGKAMARLGIEMIPASSPEARGRLERMFRTQPGASATGAGYRRHPRHDSS